VGPEQVEVGVFVKKFEHVILTEEVCGSGAVEQREGCGPEPGGAGLVLLEREWVGGAGLVLLEREWVGGAGQGGIAKAWTQAQL
jgi:hypothetical protein